MNLSVDEKWFAFWTMRRRGTANIAIANLLGISRQAVSKALRSIDGKIEAALRDMAQANRIQIETIDVGRGVLAGRSVPFQTNAYIFVSERHGMQVWYEHEGDCRSCEEYTRCREFLWDFAEELGIPIGKSGDPTQMAEELLAKIRESAK
jgi:predicted transcriptional regulator